MTSRHQISEKMNRTLTLAGVWIALVGLPLAAWADPGAAFPAARSTAKISLIDIDLATTEGTELARDRIEKAAQHLCRKLRDTRRIDDWEAYVECSRNTTADAMRQFEVELAATGNPPQRRD